MTFPSSHIKWLGPYLEPGQLTTNLVFLKKENWPQIFHSGPTSSVVYGPEGQPGLCSGIPEGSGRERDWSTFAFRGSSAWRTGQPGSRKRGGGSVNWLWSLLCPRAHHPPTPGSSFLDFLESGVCPVKSPGIPGPYSHPGADLTTQLLRGICLLKVGLGRKPHLEQEMSHQYLNSLWEWFFQEVWTFLPGGCVYINNRAEMEVSPYKEDCL